MPAKDHLGVCLPPAERNPSIRLDVEDDKVFLVALGSAPVPLTEPECRGLICDLSARWSEAYEGIHV